MRIGLVCGDGLPVSGLLTIFRNVMDIGRDMGLVDDAVVADLGYTWRPDKPGFFPSGPPGPYTPHWLVVESARAGVDTDWPAVGAELTRLRDEVADQEGLSGAEHAALTRRIEAAAEPYRRGFAAWLARHRPDWVFAVNTTLSDAPSVTLALHQAAREHYASAPGGVLFWDHDLFGSCAVHDEHTGARVYPAAPNRHTPLPRREAHTRWVVVSEALAEEARGYPTDLVPDIAPNVLPRVPSGPLQERHHAFARRLGLVQGRPVLLAPVRVFAVKGVEVALDLLAAMKAAAAGPGAAVPYLLVFGSLAEDPPYAARVVERARRLGIDDDVRFLDGVPLASFHHAGAGWQLDEIDLLRLARASAGGVVFTPAVADVETVGLGPGLAAVADLPVAVTRYDVFRSIYGVDFSCTRVENTEAGIRAAAAEFLAAIGPRAATFPDRLAANRAAVRRAFPEAPWRRLWTELAQAG